MSACFAGHINRAHFGCKLHITGLQEIWFGSSTLISKILLLWARKRQRHWVAVGPQKLVFILKKKDLLFKPKDFKEIQETTLTHSLSGAIQHGCRFKVWAFPALMLFGFCITMHYAVM